VAYHNSSIEKTDIHTIKNTEAGWHMGINLKARIYKKVFIIDFRVFQGLTDIFSMPDDLPLIYDKTQKTKIVGFNLCLGYEF
jgi:hypothetical protein